MDQVVTNHAVQTDTSFENILRPRDFRDYIGQQQVKQNLQMFMRSAKQRGVVLDHIIITGPAGTGKTTLANIIANEFNTKLQIKYGTVLQKVGDVAPIITQLKNQDILFIDEVHAISKEVEELMYPVMEDRKLDLVIGTKLSTQVVRIPVNPFTLIGATTSIGALNKPFRDRFGIILDLTTYTETELVQIIGASASRLEINITHAAARAIAKVSRGIPRIANRILSRVRDFAVVAIRDTITTYDTSIMLPSLGINTYGLDTIDRKIMEVLLKAPYNMRKMDIEPVGIKTISSVINETVETIEEVHEPFLLQEGYIAKVAGGRRATQRARELKDLCLLATVC